MSQIELLVFELRGKMMKAMCALIAVTEFNVTMPLAHIKAVYVFIKTLQQAFLSS